jgi:hypothetical protein
VEAVASFIERERPKFSVRGVDNVSLQTCDAAKLIVALLVHFTEGRHQAYNKIEDGKVITAWLLEHDARHLSAVREHVSSLLAAQLSA